MRKGSDRLANRAAAVLAASREFLRTREAVQVAPTIHGLIRHVQATIELHASLVPKGDGRVAAALFVAWRCVLNLLSDLALAYQNFAR